MADDPPFNSGRVVSGPYWPRTNGKATARAVIALLLRWWTL